DDLADLALRALKRDDKLLALRLVGPLGRQELQGAMILDPQNALFKDEWLIHDEDIGHALGPLRLPRRNEARDHVVHHLGGIALVDLRRLLALRGHGYRRIFRALELGASRGASTAEVQEAHEPDLVALIVPVQAPLAGLRGRER